MPARNIRPAKSQRRFFHMTHLPSLISPAPAARRAARPIEQVPPDGHPARRPLVVPAVARTTGALAMVRCFVAWRNEPIRNVSMRPAAGIDPYQGHRVAAGLGGS